MAKAKKIKDFDKDKMYRKIMPSALGDKPSAPMETIDDEPAPPPSSTASKRDGQLHNYMEDLVLDKMEHTMKVLESCQCDQCRKDILALSLNQLPSAYAVVMADTDQYVRKIRGTYEVKVTTAIIKAVQAVKKNPRH